MAGGSQEADELVTGGRCKVILGLTFAGHRGDVFFGIIPSPLVDWATTAGELDRRAALALGQSGGRDGSRAVADACSRAELALEPEYDGERLVDGDLAGGAGPNRLGDRRLACRRRRSAPPARRRSRTGSSVLRVDQPDRLVP